MSTDPDPRPLSPRSAVTAFGPADWWRFLCWITDRIIVTGDLPYNRSAAERQLRRWVEAGVTHVVDVRGECSDESFVRRLAPQVGYIWAPTHDAGGHQPDAWFDGTVRRIIQILEADPEAVVLIHCHMGVNRAPSLAVAVLMELGFSAVDALEAIRSARPIAGILYAEQAADWFHRRHGSSDAVRFADRLAIERWLDDNPVDVGWVISRIRCAEDAAA